jgi:hypothetical protein
MKDINIKQIIDLATQDISNPEAELKKAYEWYHERKIMIIKGTTSIALTLIISLLISYYKSEIKVDNFSLMIAIICSFLSMSYGIYELYQIKKISKKYIASITLLNKFKKIKPFISLYREILHR